MRTGAERLAQQPELIGGTRSDTRLGLFTNYTGVMADLGRNIDAFVGTGRQDLNLTTIFTPEHGLWGSVQAGESEAGGTDEASGLTVVDTYRQHGTQLDQLIRDSGVDAVLYDLQDIGARFYTYVWSLYELMESAARLGVRVVVLDRPNPLGGVHAAGPGLRDDCSSFVGRVGIPIRHGLTVGELARWFNTEFLPEAAELDVVTMDGWDRSMLWPDTGLDWVMPSPNIPTFDSALVYPGTCLLEGTNLSEGRGTTRPFEIIGAPFVDDRLRPALIERKIPGVAFRDVVVRPTFHKFADQQIRGVQLHVTDPQTFEPVSAGMEIIAVLSQLYPNDFEWYQHNPDRPPFIDLLWGSSALRDGITAGMTPEQILAESPAAPTIPSSVLLYAPVSTRGAI